VLSEKQGQRLDKGTVPEDGGLWQQTRRCAQFEIVVAKTQSLGEDGGLYHPFPT
jgi:hypothetical protein